MGARSYIVRGKGNADSFHTCSHGAGRAMSGGAAESVLRLEHRHAHALARERRRAGQPVRARAHDNRLGHATTGCRPFALVSGVVLHSALRRLPSQS